MYLKRLELLGFKSFPDKTVIKLTPGVTSIVGPNGCGKTNILDSIRWVLGEQKISLLRGSKMEEIIFNGTRDIKPLGMSEVTLVVQNNKGVLPTEYGDVQITRRLFRSGDSEYLLNKVPCRLKDITELFMDTGLGAHIYSVIQQDMIEAILSDRADDRRFLFEEAAGISKYKNRKKAAIRKLEATEGDLLRIKDIIAEINTQVNSLKRQMSKARRYKNLSDELKGWEIFLGKNSINELNYERRELLAKSDSLTDAKVKYDTEIDSLSATQEEERKKITDIDRQLTELAGQIYEKTEQAHTLETEISVYRERRENASALKEKNELDIEAFKQRKVILLEQIEETNAELSEIEQELASMTVEITASESRLAGADDKVISARKKRDELNIKLIEIEGLLSAGKSDDSNLKEQETDINNSLSNFEVQHNDLKGKKTSFLENQSTVENQINFLKIKGDQVLLRKNNIENEIGTLSSELEDVNGKIFETSASLEAAQARCHLLSDMIAHYEGFSSGVVTVMEDKERWPGLIGTVAETLIPQSGYEDAIESALGEIAGFMISETRKTAEDIIEYLKSEKKGKAGLLIANDAPLESNVTRPNINGEGFIGWADDFVSVDDNLRKLANLLLSRTAIIKSEHFDNIIEQLPPYFTAVTVDGKLYQGKAVISGGSHEGLSLLGREEKIGEQEKIIEILTRELDHSKDFRNETTSMLGSKQADLNSATLELENIKDDIDQTEKQLSTLNFQIQSIEQDCGRIENERRALKIKLEALKSRQYSLNLNYDQLTKEKSAMVNTLNKHDSVMVDYEKESESAENEFSNLQIKHIESKSKKQQLESRIRHTEELIKEIETNISIKTDENRRAEIDTNEGGEKIIEFEINLKTIFDSRNELNEKQTKIRQVHSAIQENLDNRESEIKRLRVSREESSARLHSIEIKTTEIESEIKGVKQKIDEQYKIDLEEFTVEIPNEKIPEEERKNRLLELKELLRDFGGVNMMALEEYEAATERQVFLTTQMDDLMNAKSTLQSTISKINQTAKKLFIDTLDKVRDNFRQVFAELFTGGEADIRLTDPEAPLESTIEIIARPRGKKLLSIAQMSGGERALTAISLLFAIYLVKPSPFCILDEIDAPLDDANIHRFLKIIRTFSEQTQFIVITHNKITMEAADNLYGITMEQPGVSKVVSVRFNDEVESKIIDTDYEHSKTEIDSELPAPVAERINPSVNIKTTSDPENN